MMTKILVTGVAGVVGRATVEHLIKKGVPASQIIGLSRKKEKIEDLASKGVEVRFGDYFDYDSLLLAFEGVDKVMLTSTHTFTDRFTQHFNVITAARQSGVKHIVYIPIMRKEGSGIVVPEVTESDIFTEQVLKSSGLNYTILFHPPFTEFFPFFYGSNPFENGIKFPSTNGKIAHATRDELAEAHAEVLSTPGHENKIYSLGGSEAISFADAAKILAEIKGQPVPFTPITTEEYVQGFPPHLPGWLTNWVAAIEEGVYSYQSGDMERLLGRKTKTFKEYIVSTLEAVNPL
jgi:NAD(P)H dehydrogenase (quinone)